MDSFIHEADYSFAKISEFSFYIAIGILVHEKWQKCVVSFQKSRNSNSSFSKTTDFISSIKVWIENDEF